MSIATRASESGDLQRLLGHRIKQQRRKLQLTVAALAAAADISPAYVSSIENGSAVPSLSVLARVAHALDLTLAELLRGSSSGGVALGRIDEGGDVERLSPQGSRVQIVRLRSRPGECGPAPLDHGTGDLFVHAHTGALAVIVDGERLELGEGDAVHCASPRTASWEALGAQAAATVWVAKSP